MNDKNKEIKIVEKNEVKLKRERSFIKYVFDEEVFLNKLKSSYSQFSSKVEMKDIEFKEVTVKDIQLEKTDRVLMENLLKFKISKVNLKNLSANFNVTTNFFEAIKNKMTEIDYSKFQVLVNSNKKYYIDVKQKVDLSLIALNDYKIEDINSKTDIEFPLNASFNVNKIDFTKINICPQTEYEFPSIIGIKFPTKLNLNYEIKRKVFSSFIRLNLTNKMNVYTDETEHIKIEPINDITFCKIDKVKLDFDTNIVPIHINKLANFNISVIKKEFFEKKYINKFFNLTKFNNVKCIRFNVPTEFLYSPKYSFNFIKINLESTFLLDSFNSVYINGIENICQFEDVHVKEDFFYENFLSENYPKKINYDLLDFTNLKKEYNEFLKKVEYIY